MINLEFINKEIEATKKSIKYWSMQLKKAHNDNNNANVELFTKILDERKEELQSIEDINTKLEAWEIVKNKSVDMLDFIIFSSVENYNKGRLEEYQLTKKEYDKIKKAMEV